MFSRLRLFRIPITLALLCLLGLSILFIKNSLESAWQSDRQEEALYLKSPNCFTHRDNSEVDASLPPCQNLTATVIAKPQNTVIDHRRYSNYPRTHRFFTVQYTNGYTQTVGDIDSDMWDSAQIGSQVAVVLWRGQVKEVDANGYHQSIFDEKKWNRTAAGLVPWVVIALVSSACLRLLWKLPNESARMTL
jgi:hypothetical protein